MTSYEVGDKVSMKGQANSLLTIAEIKKWAAGNTTYRIQNGFESGTKGKWVSPADIAPYGVGATGREDTGPSKTVRNPQPGVHPFFRKMG